MLRYNRQGKTIPFDDAYSWQDAHTFSEDCVLSQYKRPQQMQSKPVDYYHAAAQKNLDNILPFVDEHPNTTFYFFFPPYSILWWDLNRQAGTLDAVLEMTEYLIDRLLQYENVQVFYFQNEAEIINDLNNYRESMHFSREVNQWMAQCIAEGSHRVYPGRSAISYRI